MRRSSMLRFSSRLTIFGRGCRGPRTNRSRWTGGPNGSPGPSPKASSLVTPSSVGWAYTIGCHGRDARLDIGSVRDGARRGVATAAVSIIVQRALATAGIDHVEIHHDKANVASAGVPAKLGFTLHPRSTRRACRSRRVRNLVRMASPSVVRRRRRSTRCWRVLGLQLDGDRADAVRLGHAARKVGCGSVGWRVRFELETHEVELRGKALELGDALGDLGLLLGDQLRDSLLRGAAVRAVPDRQ